jgi:hypothetical protein
MEQMRQNVQEGYTGHGASSKLEEQTMKKNFSKKDV